MGLTIGLRSSNPDLAAHVDGEAAFPLDLDPYSSEASCIQQAVPEGR